MDSQAAAPPKPIEIRAPYKGKWLHFMEMDLVAPSGKKFTWEYVKRPNAEEGVIKANGATIIPISKQKPHKVIVEAIYRYPIGKYILELPSGLIDPGDKSVEESCTRELKEETGYVGEPATPAPIALVGAMTDPWKSSECDTMMAYSVDMEREENKNPKNELEDEELIKVHVVSLSNLHDELLALQKEHDYEIGEKIWSFASGIRLSQALSLN